MSNYCNTIVKFPHACPYGFAMSESLKIVAYGAWRFTCKYET